jgi:hypothetical protein
MKTLLTLATLAFATTSFAATMTMKLKLTGIAPEAFTAPRVNFMSNNPMCKTVGQMGLTDKVVDLYGSVKVLGVDNVEVKFPLTYPNNNFCNYKLKFVVLEQNHAGLYSSVIAFSTTYGSDRAGVGGRLYDLMTPSTSALETNCQVAIGRELAKCTDNVQGAPSLGEFFLDSAKIKKGRDIGKRLDIIVNI